MGKKGPRPTDYVCCAVQEGKLLSKSIESETSEQAIDLFTDEFGVKPDNIYGPYYRKRDTVLDNTREIEFTGISKKAIYKDWYVIASILKFPKDTAYLLFDKRVDGKKVPKPSGTFIIKLDEMKESK